jgi:hypothetical protein
VLSFAALGGRCRTCAARLGRVHLLREALGVGLGAAAGVALGIALGR